MKNLCPCSEFHALLRCYKAIFPGRYRGNMSDKEQQLRQVEKVAASAVLHGSESLCKLLRYLAHHAIEHPGTPLKEYQIATEEFGRPPDFDPAVDSMVRVQARRLRSKLLEYYAREGADDHVRIELPQGTYTLSFHKKHAASRSDRQLHPTSEHTHAVNEQGPRAWLL